MIVTEQVEKNYYLIESWRGLTKQLKQKNIGGIPQTQPFIHIQATEKYFGKNDWRSKSQKSSIIKITKAFLF
jgi:hypothetical protein